MREQEQTIAGRPRTGIRPPTPASARRPWTLLIGLGIGLTLPVQSGAAVQSLPPGRFAIGSVINSSFRQLGAVLGISVFVALGLAGGLILLIPRLSRPAELP
jgi:hypothetical protein